MATEIFQEEERFKMLDLKAYQKTKNITKHIQDAFTDKIERKWLYFVDDLAAMQWPEGFEGFKPLRRERQSIPKRQQQSVMRKVTAQPAASATIAATTINEDIPVIEASLTSLDNRRSMVKSLSPMHRESTRNLVPQDDSRIAKLTLKL